MDKLINLYYFSIPLKIRSEIWRVNLMSLSLVDCYDNMGLQTMGSGGLARLSYKQWI